MTLICMYHLYNKLFNDGRWCKFSCDLNKSTKHFSYQLQVFSQQQASDYKLKIIDHRVWIGLLFTTVRVLSEVVFGGIFNRFKFLFSINVYAMGTLISELLNF